MSLPHPTGAFTSSSLAQAEPPVAKESSVPRDGRGSSKALSTGSARGPRVGDLSEGSELISGLNLVQRVPAATRERCHVGMDALEQHFVGQATRILLLMLKILSAEQ